MKINTRTITTNYEISGRPGGGVVMLSHSLGSNLSMWDPQMEVLAERFQVLRYDTRGHGESEVLGGAYTLEELVEDASALLDAVKIERVHFIGLSMGGMIAQGLALKHPGRIASLTLCDTSASMPEAAQPVIQERIETAREEGLDALVGGTLARWFTPGYMNQKPPAVDAIRGIFRTTPVAGYIGCTEAIRRLNYLDELSRIQAPTLVVVGEDDPGTPVAAAQAIHAKIAGSKLVVIPSASHLCNIEQAEAFNTHIVDFLKTGR